MGYKILTLTFVKCYYETIVNYCHVDVDLLLHVELLFDCFLYLCYLISGSIFVMGCPADN